MPIVDSNVGSCLLVDLFSISTHVREVQLLLTLQVKFIEPMQRTSGEFSNALTYEQKWSALNQVIELKWLMNFTKE